MEQSATVDDINPASSITHYTTMIPMVLVQKDMQVLDNQQRHVKLTKTQGNDTCDDVGRDSVSIASGQMELQELP